MAVRPLALSFPKVEHLEVRQLLSTVDVTTYGAIPNDGVSDTAAIQAALNASRNGDTIYFPAGTFDIGSKLNVAANREYTGAPGATLKGRTSDGQLLSFGGDNVTIRGLTFEGGGLFFDKAGGFNNNIVIDNNVFKLNTSGKNPSAITFTSGLASSVISNNYFTGYTGGFGIYGYNYNGLTIANNEFVNVKAAMHIDAFYNSGNLLVEQNYMTGLKGMGMEFQSAASNLVFQDNWYEHPNLSTTFSDNNNAFGYSLILDKSKNVTIRRNVVIAPERPDRVGTRIGFEVGGDNTLVEDNYIDGVNHTVAMNDGVGSASVVVRNNKFKNYLQGVSNSFPRAEVSWSAYNNGPNVTLTEPMEARIANNDKPGRNKRYDGTGSIETGVSTPVGNLPDGSEGTPDAMTPPTDVTAKALSSSRIEVTWTDNSTGELGFKIERSLVDGASFVQIAVVGSNSTKFLDSNVPANTKVYYRVRVYGMTSTSEPSAVGSATTPGFAGTPTTPTTPTTPVTPTPTTPTGGGTTGGGNTGSGNTGGGGGGRTPSA